MIGTACARARHGDASAKSHDLACRPTHCHAATSAHLELSAAPVPGGEAAFASLAYGGMVTSPWDAAGAGVLRLPSGRLVRGRGLRRALPPPPPPPPPPLPPPQPPPPPSLAGPSGRRPPPCRAP